jgi:RNA polymerase sigma factor (sigma-70 family)
VKIESECLSIAGPLRNGGEEARAPLCFESMAQRNDVLSKIQFWDRLEPCRSKLYSYISKSLNFSTEADDVFQETVLRAIRYLASFRTEGDFAAWIFGIAHNEIKKHLKGARRTISSDSLDRLATPGDARTRELAREVFRYAEMLKPRPREIFFLFYDGGFSISEISDITGLREGNIKFILNRARRALKILLGESHE